MVHQNFDAGWRAQMLAVLAATLEVMSDGIHYGWSSPAVPLLEQDDSPVGKITEDNAYWLETCFWLGGLCALPLTTLSVHYLGSKKALMVTSALNGLSWLTIAFAPCIELLYIARSVAGAAGNNGFVALPTYIAEIADPRIRGILGTVIHVMNMLGVILAYTIVPFVPIWISCLVGASVNIFQLISFYGMPETPYFHLLKGNIEGAEKALKWLRGTDNVSQELEDISTAVARQSSERGKPQDILLVPSNRKAITILTFLNTSQHMCGLSVVLMNVQSIMNESGMNMSSELSAILFAAFMLGSLFIAGPIVDRSGRKALLMGSCLGTTVSLGIFGGYFLARNLGVMPENSAIKTIPLIAILAYSVLYKIGLGLIPIIMAGELFPTSIKALGMTCGDFIYNLMAIVSIKIYYWTAGSWGMHVPFLIFSAWGAFATVCTYFFVPETKGKTLEEIQLELKGIKSVHTSEQKS